MINTVHSFRVKSLVSNGSIRPRHWVCYKYTMIPISTFYFIHTWHGPWLVDLVPLTSLFSPPHTRFSTQSTCNRWGSHQSYQSSRLKMTRDQKGVLNKLYCSMFSTSGPYVILVTYCLLLYRSPDQKAIQVVSWCCTGWAKSHHARAPGDAVPERSTWV